MFSLTLWLFSVISPFLCTHVYSSPSLYLLGLNFNLLISAHSSSSRFTYSHPPGLCTCFHLSILQVWLGSARCVFQLRGAAWAWQETSLFSPPPLTLILVGWLAGFYQALYKAGVSPVWHPAWRSYSGRSVVISQRNSSSCLLVIQTKDKRGLVEYKVM